ncbi:hypothetical protein SAMN05216304_102734 [Bosea sp. OK403]|uniref:hypothetical protein n=1 Tax=Bosea sp. OK403 TaxID=1855286 RepID=UPI0008DEEFE9|nr:hypothetical protein [Bosea sp. OK403]SFI43412.1 hypothetical protein SAMN05216304_102734 [Bosea sp. OK403]
MCEGLSDSELQRLGQLIYLEMAKQLGRDARSMIDADHDLRAVVVDGSVDLVKVAAVVAKRYCVSLPDVEIVTEVAPVASPCERRSRAARAE